MKKAFLILLVIVCIAVVVWTAYLLFTNQTDPIMGGVILAVDIGVLVWNISVLRAYRIRAGTVVAVFLIVALVVMTVSAFAGIEPFAGLKDKVIGSFAGLTTRYDVDILPGQTKVVEDWKFSLDGGGWSGGTVTVKLTITNLGPRRGFGYYSLLDVGPELAAIDSTGKLVEPWVPEYSWEDVARAIQKGETLQTEPAYTREFYPNESWTGTLKFELSPYSGKTGLYMTEEYHILKYFLFDLGEPATPESKPMTPPASLQSAIIGKWRHGLPEQCPPSMASSLYEELKKLPEGKTYFLEFTNSGEVFYLDDENGTFNGTYRFVSDTYVEINWTVSSVPAAQQFFGQQGVYEVQISGETMYLTNEHQIEASYWQAS